MVIAIPENVTTANYELASQFMDYWRTLGNTILVSLTIALLQIPSFRKYFRNNISAAPWISFPG